MIPGRSCNEYSRLEHVYLIGSVVGLLVALGYAVYGIIIDQFQSEDSSFLFVFAINCGFGLIYTVKGLKYENPYDIMILVLSVAPIVAYTIVDFSIGNSTSYKKVRLILCLIFALFIGGLGVHLLVKFLKSKNFIARHGLSFSSPEERDTLTRSTNNQANETSNANLTSCLRTMLLFYFLLSVNLQCDLSAAVFTLTSGYSIRLETGDIIHADMLILFFAVIVIALLAWMFGHFSKTEKQKETLENQIEYLKAQHERKLWILCFSISSVFLLATGMYLLVQASEDVNKTDIDVTLSRVTLFTAVLMVFLRVITCTACYLAYQNFGKGLKQAVYGQSDFERGLIDRQFDNQPIANTNSVYESI